ncbi:MAG: FtsH protease activity modulator HflK [Chloroflexi bacterium]|nr:FtsH protease activity modulator HflK [Chloroflexota bacterium]|tara:strand:+ start:632 stop:1702 length:1071 start_codon:yes stop_codon:yes gene_type:complete
MYRPPRQNNERNNEEQVNIDEVLDKLKSSFPKIPGFGKGSPVLIFFIILILGIFWAGTGFYTVGPDEQAARRTFGKYIGTVNEGLHWHYPSPIGTRDVVSVTTTRRLELGFRSGPDGFTIAQAVPVESLMITGDENIVDVQAVVQYRIFNLKNFLFSVDDPGDLERGVNKGFPDGKTLRDITETALRQVVGSRNIDDVLTTEKEQVQAAVLLKMQQLAGEYNTGLQIQQLLLQNVNPPQEVQSAFEDVVKAREDRDRIINQAQAYQADQIPRAVGDAAKITESAQGFRDGRIAKAKGEAEGFESVLEGYKSSPDVTRQRLYLEAMEEILPGVKKFILDDSGVLPFLPLENAESQGN